MTAAYKRFLDAVRKLRKSGDINPTITAIAANMSPPVSKQRATTIYNDLVEKKIITRKLEILK